MALKFICAADVVKIGVVACVIMSVMGSVCVPAAVLKMIAP
jgi:hypothetical protein